MHLSSSIKRTRIFFVSMGLVESKVSDVAYLNTAYKTSRDFPPALVCTPDLSSKYSAMRQALIHSPSTHAEVSPVLCVA